MSSVGTAIVLAAGQGTRMKSAGPKVLAPLCGRPMLGWVLDQALSLGVRRVLVVVGAGAEEVRAATPPDPRIEFVLQAEQLGTGHAVQCCLPWLSGERGGAAELGTVVVLYGDMPLLSGESLAELVGTQAATAEGRGVALITAEPDKPRGFGRILRSADGARVLGVVEERDATPEQRALREVNVGVYAFPGPLLSACLPRLAADNAQGEYYLTDLVGMAVADGREVRGVRLEDPREAIGVNTLAHLSEARSGLQERILEGHLANGVRIEDPATTYIDWGVEIGVGTRILPCTVIRSGVVVGRDCEVGPFTHLRVGTVLEDGAELGNFTEAKNSTIGSHTKAKHLTYLGDVRIGARTNIGAGTIVANYDGKHKHQTVIGNDVFIGSGSVLVAPTVVGDGALTGAGAIVTRNMDVPAGEAWVGMPARFLKRLDGRKDEQHEQAERAPTGESE